MKLKMLVLRGGVKGEKISFSKKTDITDKSAFPCF